VIEPQLSILGLGVAGGFGVGKQALLDALRSGGRPNGTMAVVDPAGQRQLPAYQADVSPVGRFIPPATARRMNRFAKLALLGASLALEDAGWGLPLRRDDIGLIIASGYGASKSTFDFLDSMIDGEGQFPSPTLFSNSVHSSAASHASIVLELGGPCLTVSQFEMSPVSALLTARQWLVENRVTAVLFGAVDELCPVLAYSYDRFFGADANGPIEPFAWDKQTAVMGEGAAFFLLQRPGTGRPPSGYGSIDRIMWTQSRPLEKENRLLLHPESHQQPREGEKADRPLFRLVLGADGHTCCAAHYRRLAKIAYSPMAYTPLYGSLPGGQAFDIAIAALAAGQGLGPDRVRSIKCDADGNCGVIECDFSRGHA
jgi:3-oxoacyl-[acyl-carrier-protein] synthase II